MTAQVARVGVNVSFYIRVTDAAAAARTVERELGFFTCELGLEDPAPGILGNPSELARKFLCRAFLAPLATTRSGPWLRYWSFDRWPLTAAERRESMTIVRRIEQVCRAVGAGAYACLPDVVTIDDLSDAERARATHHLGAGDPDVIFADGG